MFKLERLCLYLTLILLPAVAYSQQLPIESYTDKNVVGQVQADATDGELLADSPADSSDSAAANNVDTEDDISTSEPGNTATADSSIDATAPDSTSSEKNIGTDDQEQAVDSGDVASPESLTSTQKEAIVPGDQIQTETADDTDTAESQTPASEVDANTDAGIQSQGNDIVHKTTPDLPAAITAKKGMAAKKDLGVKIPAAETGIRLGERRPEEQFTIDIFDRPLTIGGSFESLLNVEGDIAFDDTADDYRFINNSLSLEFFYEISESVSFFADGTLLYSKADSDWVSAAERNQTWLLFEEIYGSDIDIKIGAQYFYDERTWWWDNELDGISIEYWGEHWQAELALTQGLARRSTTEDFIDPAEENLSRLLSRVSWEHTEDHWLELFYILHNDHSVTENVGTIIASNKLDDTDADLRWFGIRSYGYQQADGFGEFDYWLDTGYVDGDETFISTGNVAGSPASEIVNDVSTAVVQGWAFDLGLTWHTEFPLSPSFTIGYAVGSGKLDEQGAVDTAFQQTGIQSNSSYFTDVNYIAYYGEFLNPELSNLKILTLGISIPLLNNTALDLVYHRYDQYVQADFLRNAGLDIDPSGNSKDIGMEVDLVFRALEFIHWEYGITAAFFRAGDAFDTDSGEMATSLSFDLRYNF